MVSYDKWFARCEDKKEIICGDDGYYLYWPAGNGGYDEGSLRAMADYLEEKNKRWDAEIERYFSGQGDLFNAK